MNDYVLEVGGPGAERLRRLARAMWPTTEALLRRVGLGLGMCCLDVGCGIGQVTLDLARWVGPGGQAVGIDADGRFTELARQEAASRGLGAAFRQGRAEELDEEGIYDLVYTRFLLTHLPDPARAIAAMVRATRPGGAVTVEDIDFDGSFCYPPSAAFSRYIELYQDVVRRRGGDPNIGPRLADLLEDAGLDAIRIGVVQPVFRGGDGPRIAALTMAGIGQAVAESGLATAVEVESLVAELEAIAQSPRCIESLPRYFQVWGRRVGG